MIEKSFAAVKFAGIAAGQPHLVSMITDYILADT